MVIYYAIVLLAMLGAGFFYGPLIAKWVKDLWSSYFKNGDDE